MMEMCCPLSTVVFTDKQQIKREKLVLHLMALFLLLCIDSPLGVSSRDGISYQLHTSSGMSNRCVMPKVRRWCNCLLFPTHSAATPTSSSHLPASPDPLHMSYLSW